MYYVYCIQNFRREDFYYGYTEDLIRRMKEHKSEDRACELIYYEAYRSKQDATKREKKLKDYGQSRTHLKNRISNSILK
jgi:predicted GIY-YIG superfamily endonuclease